MIRKKEKDFTPNYIYTNIYTYIYTIYILLHLNATSTTILLHILYYSFPCYPYTKSHFEITRCMKKNQSVSDKKSCVCPAD